MSGRAGIVIVFAIDAAFKSSSQVPTEKKEDSRLQIPSTAEGSPTCIRPVPPTIILAAAEIAPPRQCHPSGMPRQ